VLAAARVNSFLNRSREPNSPFRASARAPFGSPLFEAGARFDQKRLWRTCPPAWKESSFRVAFISTSVFAFRAASSLSRTALAPFT
jgi:hypothetical protein